MEVGVQQSQHPQYYGVWRTVVGQKCPVREIHWAGGGAPGEETKSYKDEGKDKANDKDKDIGNDKGKDENRCIVNFVSKARSKEIRLRLDEERKERIAKRFLTLQ